MTVALAIIFFSATGINHISGNIHFNLTAVVVGWPCIRLRSHTTRSVYGSKNATELVGVVAISAQS